MFATPFSPLLGDVADGLWFPTQASTFAREVDSTFDMILWISLVFFIGIVVAMLWFPYKYSQAKGGKATSRVRHHNLLEISWSVFPSFLLVIMFVRGSWGYLDMREAPTGAVDVHVEAKKWNWTFDYGNGLISPELHLVVNQPSRMIMESPDVIHSMFIPAFRIKRDVVPGRYNYVWFEATKTTPKVSDEELKDGLARANSEFGGIFDPVKLGFTRDGYSYFDLYCTEYCGTDHSMMQTVVVVHETQEELNAWFDTLRVKPPTETYEDYGRRLYAERGCASCHSLDGSKKTGPTFANIGLPRMLTSGETIEADENYIRESILAPKAKVVSGYQPVMPSYKGQLTDDQIQGLVEFVKSVGRK